MKKIEAQEIHSPAPFYGGIVDGQASKDRETAFKGQR